MKASIQKLVKPLLLGSLALSSAFAVNAQANEKGNGGRSIVCWGAENPKTHVREVIRAEFLDYAETALSRWEIDLGPESLTVDQMIEVALGRLEKRDPQRVERIRKKILEIKNPNLTLMFDLNSVGATKTSLGAALIADMTASVKPLTGNCNEEQAALNVVNPGIMNYKYIFVKQYVEKMSHRDQAGIILHEAIYNDEAENGAVSSDGTREIVKAISSKQFSALYPDQYLAFMKEHSKIVTGVLTSVGYFRSGSWTNGKLNRGILIEPQSYSKFEIPCTAGEPLKINLPLQASAGSDVGFDESTQRVIFFGGIVAEGSPVSTEYGDNLKCAYENHNLILFRGNREYGHYKTYYLNNQLTLKEDHYQNELDYHSELGRIIFQQRDGNITLFYNAQEKLEKMELYVKANVDHGMIIRTSKKAFVTDQFGNSFKLKLNEKSKWVFRFAENGSISSNALEQTDEQPRSSMGKSK